MSLFIQPANICSVENPSFQSLSLNEESPELNFQPESNCLVHPNSDSMTLILSTLKKEEDLTLKEKLEFSYYLSFAISNFTEDMMKEFNEEECHLTLLNWVWRYGKKFKEFRIENEIKNSINLNQNFEIFFPKYNILLIEINFIMELLINILNIFIFLPITSNEILNLKLYEKLSKIKKYIKSYANQNILNLIDIVLQKWKNQVDVENEEKIIARFKLNKLGIKRNRTVEEKIEEQATEADSVDNDTNIDYINNINNNNIIIPNNGNINLNKKIKNKKIKISFDLSQNSVCYFNKDDMPFQITLDKQKNKTEIKSALSSSIK
jgi:hypothetical protein